MKGPLNSDGRLSVDSSQLLQKVVENLGKKIFKLGSNEDNVTMLLTSIFFLVSLLIANQES